MIKLTFNNWELCAYRAEPPAYQYDDGTVVVVVDGDIPFGWAWELLIAYEDNLDIAVMEQSDEGLTVALSAQQLAFSGYYTMQLRASHGTLVKHSAPVMVYIGGSLSGDEHWPEIPTAFTQAIARAEAAIAEAQEVQDAVEQSEAAAAQSAGDAAGSATNAAQSATAAAQGATEAGSYATSATESAESASQSATAAAESATAAEGAVSQYPRISTATGNWEVWDAAAGAWTDTGVHAQGDPGAVQDVQVNGQSILAGGVAKIPVAAVTTPGVARANGTYGVAVQGDGNLTTNPATVADINGRASYYRPIVPGTLDVAVKTAMTDGRGPAWTQAEQLAARQRLGLEKEWVLVDEIVLQGETSIYRDADRSGLPYRYKALMYTIKVPSGIQITTATSVSTSALDSGSYCTVQSLPVKTDVQKTTYAAGMHIIVYGRLISMCTGAGIVDVGSTFNYNSRFRLSARSSP